MIVFCINQSTATPEDVSGLQADLDTQIITSWQNMANEIHSQKCYVLKLSYTKSQDQLTHNLVSQLYRN